MPWPLIAAAAASVIGGALAYKGGSDASKAQRDAARKSSDTQWLMYSQQREDLEPYRDAGEWALGGRFNAQEYLRQNPDVAADSYYGTRPEEHYYNFGRDEGRDPGSDVGLVGMIRQGPGEFEESPGYQFTLAEGLKGQQNALSAMGRNRSGTHLRASTQYAENLASTEYDNFLRRWYQSLNPYENLAGLGQNTAGQTAALGSNAAGNVSRSQLYAGDARAAGDINQANALTGALSGGVNNLLYYNALRNLPQQQQTQYPNVQTIRGGGYTGGYGF